MQLKEYLEEIYSLKYTNEQGLAGVGGLRWMS